jgi:hypothetical protein
MSAVSTLLKLAATLPGDTEAAKLLSDAIEQLDDGVGRREERIDRERVRLMRAGEVLKCLAVAIDEEADVVASDVIQLVAEIVIGATHGLDSTALKRKGGASC